MVKKWKLIKSEPVFESPFITLNKETLEKADGSRVENFFSIKRKEAVYVVALDSLTQVLLVFQYKNGVKDLIWEIPAGFINEGEKPEEAAKRELKEETGYEAETYQMIGEFFPNTGSSQTKNYFFLAKKAKKTSEQNLDEHEEIEVKLFDFAKLVLDIKEGNSPLVDSQSCLALLLSWERVSN